MSATDRFLYFLFSHQLLLIETLFAVIIGLCILWLFANLHAESRNTDSDKQIKDIEKALEKALASAKPPQFPTSAEPAKPGAAASTTAATTATAAPAASAPGATPAPAAAAPTAEQLAELNKLKAENDAKNQKLAELEKTLNLAKEELAKAQSKSAEGGGSTEELGKKIKDLESRLSEYEIIEDDIANLSLYKEENTRLKNELQKLKVAPEAPAAAPAPAPAPKAAEPAAPIPAPEASPLAKEIDQEKLVAEVAELAAQPVPPPSPTADNKDGGEKLIEEFESFMKEAGKS